MDAQAVKDVDDCVVGTYKKYLYHVLLLTFVIRQEQILEFFSRMSNYFLVELAEIITKIADICKTIR